VNVLIVDNGTSCLAELKAWLGTMPCTVAALGENLDLKRYDLVVLSGGHTDPVLDHEREYAEELKIVRSGEVPVIGICLGFEIIAYAFGSNLIRMKRKEHGPLAIVPEAPLPFTLRDEPEFESHFWCVTQLGADLVPLARSKDGIEIIQHRTLPLVGFQFHPEITGNPSAEDVIVALQKIQS
jgi:anthranilate synthase component 2